MAEEPSESDSNLPPSNVGTGQESRLDQIIKGTPAAGSKAAQVATAYVQTPSIHVPHPSDPAAPTSTSTSTSTSTPTPTSTYTSPATSFSAATGARSGLFASHDVSSSSSSTRPVIPNPLDNHPTSPPTIYLNLIILEASLRAQYQRLHLRRRKYTVFLFLLCIWIGYFFNAVYIVGPSPYSIISTFQNLCLLGGIVTGLLFWMSGLYAKTMIWPRRLVGNVNKGLRMFNVKLVVVNRSFSQRMRDWLEIVAKRHPLGWIYSVGLKRVPPPRMVHVRSRGHSNAMRPGAAAAAGSIGGVAGLRAGFSLPGTPGTPPPRSAADVALAQRALGNTRQQQPVTADGFDPEDYLESGMNVKLVILAKHFSADFREGWEIYRSEYWEKENERRAVEVQAIKTSILETGHLPPMNSHGVIVGAGISSTTPTGPVFPGISGRPARKPSVSSGTTRPRARSSASSVVTDPDGTIRSTGTPTRGRLRMGHKKSSSSLRHLGPMEDRIENEKASMDVKLKRRSLTRTPEAESSSSTLDGRGTPTPPPPQLPLSSPSSPPSPPSTSSSPSPSPPSTISPSSPQSTSPSSPPSSSPPSSLPPQSPPPQSPPTSSSTPPPSPPPPSSTPPPT
ncbi:hypothetical protein TWF718_009503 [Orbilia javanica]|uniref:Uncharacterized protein n=1 Tax=Orbilia javanica TaxID=47235 RepID=A0AAN8NQI1_9PEZI